MSDERGRSVKGYRNRKKEKSKNFSRNQVSPSLNPKPTPGEHLSLSAIHNAVPSLCPASFAHGNLSNTRGTFLITEYLDTKASEPSPTPKTPPLSLAQKLAQLHSTPAPPGTQFGFPVATYCGSTAQENNFTASWADFYAERRIRAIGRAIKANHGGDSALESLIEKTAGKVVPRLLGGGHLGGKEGIKPVLVHGDLWSGNVGRGRISGRGSGDSGGGGGGGGGAVEQIIFDPSSCYAHSEYELGIMRMFGGFSSKFFNEYHGIVPKTEPVGEYEDRIELYEL